AAPAGRLAPLNPAFVAYQHQFRTMGPNATLKTLVPVPVNTRPWAKAALPLGPLALGSSYDPAYDLRTVGKVSPVRNQYQFNVCWVFASLASLESSLLPADPQDFSEDNLAVAAGSEFDTGLYNPGNYCMTTAELARWNGPVTESAEPYGSGAFVSGLKPLAHVQNVLFLPDRTSPTDNDTIKWAIETYGAVYSGIYADSGMSSSSTSAYYDPATSSYYYDGSSAADHAVDIVGWDDDYDPANLNAGRPVADQIPADQLPGKGAFLVRNSWGSSWGDGGYFWVFYDDVQIGRGMAVFTGEPTTDYAQNFGYDRLGFTDQWGYGSDTGWMAAAFTPKGDSPLEAASFYAQTPDTAYDVYVASSLNDQSTWTLEATGTEVVPGYHTVSFAAQPVAKAGVRFYVIVRLTTPGYDYPIAVEDAEAGYSSQATTAPGRSFSSAHGSPGTWTDLATDAGPYPPADVCLKAFAGAAIADPIRPVTRALAAVTVVRGRSATLRYRVSDATSHDVESVTIRIRNHAGKTVKTIAAGTHAPGVSLSQRYRCRLARGSYRFYVYATDRWGNTQSSVGHATLTVK
ncbi:MAG TPA: lectin like domain-containing protein, partial [Thermoleophilia bacterium]|nr:lectin like domain-containing protein [Thermoleophilia bacterium]